MNYRTALAKGTEYLKSQGVEEASADAWLLLEFCTGVNRTRYFLIQTEEMKKEQEERYHNLIEKRGKRIPLQYLTGSQMFYGRTFCVGPQVLVPRQDTEVLVEESLKKIRDGQRVMDICTGSGCIIITLASEKKIQAEAVDISEEALKIAEENAVRNHCEVRFFQSDLMKNAEGMFDCIVSNPPYIPTEEIGNLMPEVRDHEPVLALDGREDGLYFYRRIVEDAWDHLTDGGWLLFEIGFDQAAEVSEMMKHKGYHEIEVKKDLAGLDRVVMGQK